MRWYVWLDMDKFCNTMWQLSSITKRFTFLKNRFYTSVCTQLNQDKQREQNIVAAQKVLSLFLWKENCSVISES